jgi:uncharacterized protein (DUF433 family)
MAGAMADSTIQTFSTGPPVHRLRGVKIDWRECAAVESVPGKMSGQPVIRGTRVRPQDLLVNRREGVEWLSENFTIPVETIREVFAFYDARVRHRAPHPVG